MASSMAQVEPLPLVPATMITGQLKASCRRSLTARTRSRPMSMWVSAWRDSSSASQSGKVVGSVGIGWDFGDGAQGAGADTFASAPGMKSGEDFDSLVLQQCQQA